MTLRHIGSLALFAGLLVACAKSSDSPNGAAGHSALHSGAGGSGAAGRVASSSGTNGGAQAGRNSNTGGKGSAGVSGDGCPRDIAIPTLCRVCADGSCGAPSCSGGKFTGFACPNEADGGAAGAAAGSGGADASTKPSGLHWVQSCGAPVCQSGDGFYDDPNIPNCKTEQEGQTCTTDGQRCDGVVSCGATLLCAAQAPQQCPKSRAHYKQDISYLNEAERAQFHDQITQLRLASYRYKGAPDVPQLGFMIDDVEPSVAVSGDHVNLYAYLSMAVAAIQVQDRQIKGLKRELEQLRASRDPESSQVCISDE